MFINKNLPRTKVVCTFQGEASLLIEIYQLNGFINQFCPPNSAKVSNYAVNT